MKKDVILFINAMRPQSVAALKKYENETGRSFTPVILVDDKIKDSIFERNVQHKLPKDITRISADFDSAKSIRKALNPYMDRIFSVTSQYENSVLELKKLIPYLPHLDMPTEMSLEWGTEKKLMRELLESYNPDLVPAYMEVTDSKQSTIDHIEKTMTFPLIVKPSGLEGSLLVSRVENRSELEVTLKRTLQEVQKAYDKWIKRQTPTLLVEEFMDGDMYSIDTYVSKDGTCYSNPPIKQVTGRKVGFDDFFIYMNLAPSGLSDEEIAKGHVAAEQACHALGLRSVVAHIELMHMPTGWKIIELGPRLGGYRHEIYDMTYDINHIVNDIRNRAGEEPIMPLDVIAHTAVFDLYAREEGVLEGISGLDEIRALSSFVSLNQDAQIGDHVYFVRNNGDPVVSVYLRNEDRARLLEDIRTMESVIKFHVKTPS